MKTYDEEKQYIKSLSEKEKITLEIARRLLGSSFSLTKSIGFTRWKTKRKHN